MHTYKVYFQDSKEHFEILENEKVIYEYVNDFGEAITYFIYDSKFYLLAKKLINQALHNYLKDNEIREVNYDNKNIPFFMFFYDVYKQYVDGKIEQPPTENSWFQYKRTEENELESYLVTKEIITEFYNRLSENKSVLNLDYSAFDRKLNYRLELINNSLVEVLHPQHIEDILMFYIINTLNFLKFTKISIKKCNRCNRVFINFAYGKSIHYCNKILGPDNMTCKEWFDNRYCTSKDKIFAKQVKLIYSRYYDYQSRKKRKKLITPEQFTLWSKSTKHIKTQCLNEEITIKDMEDWLEANKDNYDWE
jgi:hypothetical protein